jgi:hypothetical protein
MKLYSIPEETIINIIETLEAHYTDDGKIIYISSKNGNEYPLKVICKKKNDQLIVISCYPLKRRN